MDSIKRTPSSPQNTFLNAQSTGGHFNNLPVSSETSGQNLAHQNTTASESLVPNNQALTLEHRANDVIQVISDAMEKTSESTSKPQPTREDKIIQKAKEEITNALSQFLDANKADQATTLESIRNTLKNAKAKLTKTSFFGKARINEIALSRIAQHFNNLIESTSKNSTDFLKMQQLFAIQSELAKDELLDIGRSPEYKHAQKLINSLTQNIKLIHHLSSTQPTESQLKEVMGKLSHNCEELKVYLNENKLSEKDYPAMHEAISEFQNVLKKHLGTDANQLTQWIDSLRIAQINILRTADTVKHSLSNQLAQKAEIAHKHGKKINTLKAIALTVGITGTIAASITGMVCGILATVTGVGATAGIPLIAASAMGLVAAISLNYMTKGKLTEYVKKSIASDDFILNRAWGTKSEADDLAVDRFLINYDTGLQKATKHDAIMDFFSRKEDPSSKGYFQDILLNKLPQGPWPKETNKRSIDKRLKKEQMKLRDNMVDAISTKTNGEVKSITANTLFEHYQAEMVNEIKYDIANLGSDDTKLALEARQRLDAIFDKKHGLSLENKNLLKKSQNGLLTTQEIKDLFNFKYFP